MSEKVATRNSADKEQVAAAGRKEEIRREREVNDLKSQMSTVYGRRYMRRLIVDIAGVDRSTYLGNLTGRDSDRDFLEGMRNMGLQLKAEVLEHCPDEWALAEKEHRQMLLQERS
jgi:hypothetical protein